MEKRYLVQYGTKSFQLPGPEKRFALSFAADAVREVNSQRDVDGERFARKAMNKCEQAIWYAREYVLGSEARDM